MVALGKQTLANLCGRSRLLFFVPALLAIILIALGYDRVYANDHHDSGHGSLSFFWQSYHRGGYNLDAEIERLWGDAKHGLTEPHFTTRLGKVYNITEGTHKYTENLGNRVLVIDIDSRLNPNQIGSLMSSVPLSRGSITPRAAGFLNHYLFSRIHGYDYRAVRAPNPKDRHGTWVKVSVLKAALRTYDFVVFLDGDALIQHLNLPLEWTMSLWNVTDRTIVTMAEDPNTSGNRDEKDWVLWNTGFIIAQRTDLAQQMFQDWEDCPTGQKYENCTKWAREWAHEQAAFGNFVRYDYLNETLGLPCREANGASYIGQCEGYFVSHHWRKKAASIQELYERVSEEFVVRLQQELVHNKDKYYRDLSSFTFPLDNVVI
jgi:hypothetical protein